jgi:hypothetical protein
MRSKNTWLLLGELTVWGHNIILTQRLPKKEIPGEKSEVTNEKPKRFDHLHYDLVQENVILRNSADIVGKNYNEQDPKGSQAFPSPQVRSKVQVNPLCRRTVFISLQKWQWIGSERPIVAAESLIILTA